ncbi:ABC transporter permease [Roseiconus lacunae]|uniref:ABC transporter permease n=1 Tax=Roseiconus lacunae TaxID=2605694 RepID=UPI0011F3FCE3|nr:FtsX-like permease family protein [Roseiconus lacunae]
MRTPMGLMPTGAVTVLLRASVRSHRGRLLASAIAISFAASILLSALVGRRSLLDQAPRTADALLGRLELHLAATDSVHPYIDRALVEAMRADIRVAELHTAMTVRAVDMPGLESGGLDRESFNSMERGGMGGWISGRRDAYLAWDDGGPKGELSSGSWPASDGVDPIEIVVREGYALGLTLDSWRRLESDAGVFRGHVVGVAKSVDSPTYSHPEVRFMYRQISRAAAERLAGRKLPPSDARLTFGSVADRDSFKSNWAARVSQLPGHIEIWDNADIQRANRETSGAAASRTAVYTALLLSASFVVFIAVGVQGTSVRERTAQLSLLRALGATRGTLASVVFAEAGLLSVAGLTGAVAICWGLLALVNSYLPFLKLGAEPDLLSVFQTGGVVFASALIGSARPALVASYTSSVRGTASDSDPRTNLRLASKLASFAIGIGLISFVAISMTPAGTLDRARAAAWAGIPTLVIAAVLVTPLVIWLVCRVFVVPIAWLTRMPPLVLSNQVSGDGSRSAGAVLSISVGIGAFLWLMCWGASMLHSFMIDPAIPRWFVSIHPFGLDQDETEQILAASEFQGFQPLTLFDTRIRSEDESTVPTLVMGIDSERLQDEVTELPIRLIDGDHSKSISDLIDRHHCLLSDWYARSADVKVGDMITIDVPDIDGPTSRRYTVAAIVEMSGWRMMTKLNKVRLRGDKHQAMVVLDAETVRGDFPVAYANYLLGSPKPDSEGSISRYRSDLPKAEAHQLASRQREAVESALSKRIDLHRPIMYQPDGGTAVRLTQRIVQVDDLDRTRSELMGDWGAGVAKRMGWGPLMVLLLSLIAVSATLQESLRAHAFEIGVLRSCGLTRFGLLRLVLGESLLIGIAAVVIASLVGVTGAFILLEVSSIVGFRLDFAGIRPSFFVPWQWLWPGWVMTIFVCVFTALIAGWRISRRTPAGLMSGKLNLKIKDIA